MSDTGPVRLRHDPEAGDPLPEGAVFVGPGSPWANPYRVGELYFRSDLVRTEWLRHTPASAADFYARNVGDWYADDDRPWLDVAREALAGRDLACTCEPDRPCHADIVLRLVNGPVPDPT